MFIVSGVARASCVLPVLRVAGGRGLAVGGVHAFRVPALLTVGRWPRTSGWGEMALIGVQMSEVSMVRRHDGDGQEEDI